MRRFQQNYISISPYRNNSVISMFSLAFVSQQLSSSTALCSCSLAITLLFSSFWGNDSVRHHANENGSWESYDHYLRRLTVPLGEEFQVNTYVSGNQLDPDVCALQDGSFVITWYSTDQDGSGHGIYAQHFSASGDPVGNEFLVNTHTTDYQSIPSIGALTGGGYVITWSSFGQDGSEYGVYAQLFTSADAPDGPEFRVNTHTTYSQHYSVTASLTTGGFVIAWVSYEQDGWSTGIYAQNYASDGSIVGSEFRVNTYTNNDQDLPAIAGLADGGFVIAWQSDGQDGSGDGIYAQRYTSSGVTTGSEFHVSTDTMGPQELAAVAGLTNGGFVIIWESIGGELLEIYAQMYSSSGIAVGSQF